MELAYRKATEEDIDFLFDLRMQTMTEHYVSSHLPTDEESTIKRILYRFENAHLIIVENQPIGLLKLSINEKDIEILQLQIHPALQGKGIGKSILKGILSKAASSQKTVRLSVLKTNQAKRLYLSLGFKIISEDQHSFHMEFNH